MRSQAYNPDITPGCLIIRQRIKPFPSRSELLNRNSFDNEHRLNNNKYLTARLKEMQKCQ
nr:MAG TPA: Protein of unknown function (DUF2737) [Caudoviricetes sp.]